MGRKRCRSEKNIFRQEGKSELLCSVCRTVAPGEVVELLAIPNPACSPRPHLLQSVKLSRVSSRHSKASPGQRSGCTLSESLRKVDLMVASVASYGMPNS